MKKSVLQNSKQRQVYIKENGNLAYLNVNIKKLKTKKNEIILIILIQRLTCIFMQKKKPKHLFILHVMITPGT